MLIKLVLVSLGSYRMAKLNFRKLNLNLLKKLPPEEKRITISTLVTLLRIVLSPFIVGAMIANMWGPAFFLFVIASFLDILDGNLARLLNEKTFLGACLDPIADKLLLIPCFFTLAFVQSPLFSIPIWFVLLVLLKDSIVIFGSFALYVYKGHLEVHPTIIGKLTTVMQSLFIIWLFACYFFQWMPIKTYYTMLAAVTVLVFVSLFQYLKMGMDQWRR